MYFFWMLVFALTLVVGGPYVVLSIIGVIWGGGDAFNQPLIVLTFVIVPALLWLSGTQIGRIMKKNRRQIEHMINELIKGHPNLTLEKRGSLLTSERHPTGMSFYANNQVILASAQDGEHYVERFDIDELGWREIRNSKGEYLGIEVFPPAGYRPRNGTLKVWTGWRIPGDARAIYGTNGIPLP